MKNLHGTDQRTMAFINLFGVLGSLEELCALDSSAAGILGDADISVAFQVSGGPSAALRFQQGRCTMTPGTDNADIRLAFSSPEKFNGMIDGTVTPIPRKGITKARFLTGPFTALTDLLTCYLRASAEDLADAEFFRRSTTLMFYVIASALSQIGNRDRIGRASASYMPDGVISMQIAGGPAAAIGVRDHVLRTVKSAPEKPSAVMEFGSMEIARDLFDGKRNSLASIGVGDIRVRGLMPLLDNMNRILDRVSMYLA